MLDALILFYEAIIPLHQDFEHPAYWNSVLEVHSGRSPLQFWLYGRGTKFQSVPVHSDMALSSFQSNLPPDWLSHNHKSPRTGKKKVLIRSAYGVLPTNLNCCGENSFRTFWLTPWLLWWILFWITFCPSPSRVVHKTPHGIGGYSFQIDIVQPESILY
jgi:hypothetical protein